MSRALDDGGPTPTAWVGWVAFAGTMMMLVGGFNVVDGLVAVLDDDALVTGSQGTPVLDATTWGWVHVVLGVAVCGAGVALTSGAMWARMVGLALALLNMLTQLVSLSANPWWGTVIIGVDALVVWALIVHGDEVRQVHIEPAAVNPRERVVPRPMA